MGLQRFFKRYAPERHHLEKHGRLHLFSGRLHDPNIWHITRRSVPGAVANGLFWAFMPIPGQTLMAIACAIYFRINLPISVLFAWVTNPVTIYPTFYAAYKLGSILLNVPEQSVHFEMSWHWFASTLGGIWQPLTLGCLILGISSSVVSYYFIRWLWRFTAIRKWEERLEKNRQRRKQNKEI